MKKILIGIAGLILYASASDKFEVTFACQDYLSWKHVTVVVEADYSGIKEWAEKNAERICREHHHTSAGHVYNIKRM